VRAKTPLGTLLWALVIISKRSLAPPSTLANPLSLAYFISLPSDPFSEHYAVSNDYYCFSCPFFLYK
jgi:hypothetical protein